MTVVDTVESIGLLETVRTPERRSTASKLGLIVFGILSVACIVAFAPLGSNNVNTSLDMNRDRFNFAVMKGVQEKAQEVMDPTLGKDLRFAIFGFTKDRESVIPIIEKAKSNDWEADWSSFKNSLPEADIAAAVYNFPYWVSDSEFTEESILITWRPDNVDPRELARGGYFLGSVILSTKGVQRKFALTSIDESYSNYCVSVMGIDSDFCAMERDFHNCPFGPSSEDAEDMQSPCDATECDGATFEDYKEAAPGSMPDSCCDYVADFCQVYEDFPGCHPVSMINFELLCKIKDPDQVPTVFVDPDYIACEEECKQPCTMFDDPKDTFEKCSACPSDLMKHEEYDNVVMQCHPEALGFRLSRCCGFSEECTSDLSQDECETLESFSCKFIDHYQCVGLVQQQQVSAEEVEAAEAARIASLETEEEEAGDELAEMSA